MTCAYRYALYFSPPDPWRAAGSCWLGRCAETGRSIPRPDNADPRLDKWTEAPRHYGLHATLKAPFRLNHHGTPAQLDAASRELATTFEPFHVTIARKRLRGFIAWCLGDEPVGHTDMRALADTVVAHLDTFRAPPLPDELARRQEHTLGPAEQKMLARWGYPYAFETFAFHMTLTGQLSEHALTSADRIFAAAGGDVLPARMPVDGFSIYVQPGQGEAFLAARHYAFDGSIRDAAGVQFLNPDRRAAAADGATARTTLHLSD